MSDPYQPNRLKFLALHILRETLVEQSKDYRVTSDELARYQQRIEALDTAINEHPDNPENTKEEQAHG